MRKVHEVEREPSREGKEEKVKEALFGDDGLEKDRHDEDGVLTEKRVKEVVEDQEGRERRMDQKGIGLS
jgi:hypothetical protein